MHARNPKSARRRIKLFEPVSPADPLSFGSQANNNGGEVCAKKPARSGKLPSVDITWTDDGTVIRGLRRRWWAQRRFVACNEHVHPLSLTSTLPCYIWPVSRYIYLSRAYVGHPQIPSCFLNVKYGRLASRGAPLRGSLFARKMQSSLSLYLLFCTCA